MTLHLLKMAVGIDLVAHLARVQKARRAQRRAAGERPLTWHFTRNFPRRAAEVLDGGSMYWIIRGEIVARQPIVALEERRRGDGRKRCAIGLAAKIVRTQPIAHRAIQGWRYLEAGDVPPDLAGAPQQPKGAEKLPDGMARELRELGLL
ncbi:MAG TPA: DUF1489 domain-containing protein [Alphaproteobacteria bacterium]|nr:DUF1489 domain-containing protein [Alphaproteobacteria bacterium]